MVIQLILAVTLKTARVNYSHIDHIVNQHGFYLTQQRNI